MRHQDINTLAKTTGLLGASMADLATGEMTPQEAIAMGYLGAQTIHGFAELQRQPYFKQFGGIEDVHLPFEDEDEEARRAKIAFHQNQINELSATA